MQQIKEEALSNIDSSESLADLNTILDKTLEEFKEVELKDNLEDYIQENYPEYKDNEELKIIIDDIVNDITKDNYNDEDDINEIVNNLENEIVDKVIEIKREEKVIDFTKEYNNYANSNNYSEEQLDQIEEIYDEFINEIKDKPIDQIDELLNEKLKDLDNVKITRNTSGEFEVGDTDIKYDNPDTKDYYSGIENTIGMNKDSKVYIKEEDITKENIDKINELNTNDEYKNKNPFLKLNVTLKDKDVNEVTTLKEHIKYHSYYPKNIKTEKK